MTDGKTISNAAFVLHPKGYTLPSPGNVLVELCIVPATPNSGVMSQALVNIAAKLTALAGQTGNLLPGGGDAVPAGSMDFESVAFHEVGYCLGLAHPNAATESGLTEPDRNYTKAAWGANTTFNLGIGTDAVRGSSDDIRTPDDLNVHWFRTTSNDPCNAPGTATFDSTTYSNLAASLPIGDTFAANADRTVCANVVPAAASTEAVMQQLSFTGESQRFLGHDDEATLGHVG